MADGFLTKDSYSKPLHRKRRRVVNVASLRKPKPKPAPKPRIQKQPKQKKFLPEWVAQLDAVLQKECSTWRDNLPLTNDGTVEKNIYRIGAEQRMKASKRIVSNLLAKHKGREEYLRNLGSGAVRYDWHGEPREAIRQSEKDSAGQKLAAILS